MLGGMLWSLRNSHTLDTDSSGTNFSGHRRNFALVKSPALSLCCCPTDTRGDALVSSLAWHPFAWGLPGAVCSSCGNQGILLQSLSVVLVTAFTICAAAVPSVTI